MWRESDSTVAVTGTVRVQGGIECTSRVGSCSLLSRSLDMVQSAYLFSSSTLYNIIDAMVDQPTWIPTLQIDTQKPNAKMGVGWCDFNSDGTLFASRNGMLP